MTKSNLNWARNIAETFSRLGVEQVCISPGSRNTPLTIAFVENNQLRCHSIIDERSNGFFALGIAKATRKPVIILTTSGTATANLYPAIIEANLSCTPLIILTADRPEYLIGTGANQTIDQKDLYGNHVRGFVDLGLPSYLEKLLIVLKKSYLLSMGLNNCKKQINPPGPIHLNFPFDEPLVLKKEINQKYIFNQSLYKNLKIERYNQQINKEKIPLPLLESMIKKNKILFICGEGLIKIERDHLIKLAEKWNISIFADPLSNIRFGYNSKNIMSHYEFYIKKISLPDLIIRFGKKPNSKILNEYLEINKNKVILFNPIGRFNDNVKFIKPYSVIQIPILKRNINNKFFNEIIKKENYFIKNLNIQLDNFSEKEIIQTCIKKIPKNSNCFIGNSMPIRYIDRFVSTNKKKLLLLGNRGVSGIDGIISTALGGAIVNQQKKKYIINW